jgi:cysteine desulfurase
LLGLHPHVIELGILLVKNNTPIEYSQLGGEQETKRRAGTESVPQIVGMTKALEGQSFLPLNHWLQMELHVLANLLKIVLLIALNEYYKELFLVSLQERAIPFEVNGSMVETTGHILNLYFSSYF